MNLSRGIKKSPVRAVIYSPEGRGKSTLASLLPDPVFVDVEGGTYELDVARFEPETWADIFAVIEKIGREYKGQFRTVVIDTADWAERLAAQDVCKVMGVASMEDFTYQKGYIQMCERFAKLIAYGERLIISGFNVVFLAHSKTVKVSPPDQIDGYTKHELTLYNSDKASNARHLKEWANMVLFINDDATVMKGRDGKSKAVGGTGRVIHCVGSAAFDAKNRYELPETLPFEKGVLPEELHRVFYQQIAPTVPKPDTIPGTAGDDTAPGPVPSEARRENSPVHAPTVPKAAGEPVEEDMERAMIEQGDEKNALANGIPGTFADPDLAKMFGGQEAAAHAFLVFAKWLTQDQPLSALSFERVAQIKARPGPFAVKAKLTLNQGAA